ncbi:CpsD/CapB family tyrosine-protein kinase [Bradyrhizobium genosp. P]|uniref:CpsD/CapB family tyrosine-protein kinase n=1 Tax=Bradyrhizobium genosp. P TaxID=83641 RepID=UPI003CECEBC6
MDQFKKAVDRARGVVSPGSEQDLIEQKPHAVQARSLPQDVRSKTFPLRPAHLESMRIIAHNKDDQHTAYFDMLRTQVLHSMDANGWQFVAVTAPTPECGKTVTACNLALSMARLSERPVLLVDLDMRRPRVARYLGIEAEFGVLSVLQGYKHLSEVIVQVGIEREQLLVLPGEQARSSAEWMASPNMASLLDGIKREFRSHIVLMDMPPLLVGDDVLSILPNLQSVLLVAEAGASSLSEIRECMKHLKATPVVRVVLNKVTERDPTALYYKYY